MKVGFGDYSKVKFFAISALLLKFAQRIFLSVKF